MKLIRRLIAAYYSRFASCKPVKLNPTKWERRVKLYRILFKRWWRANGLVVSLLVSLAWIWLDLMGVV